MDPIKKKRIPKETAVQWDWAKFWVLRHLHNGLVKEESVLHIS